MQILKSLLRSFKNAFLTDKEIKKIRCAHPRIIFFLKERYNKKKFAGLPLTILSVAFLYILLLFFGIIIDFITSDTIVSVDERINTLFYIFRNITAIKTFLWITLLGKDSTVIIFAVIASYFLYLTRKKWEIMALWLAIVGSEGFTFIAKIIFHRRRPSTAVYFESTSSFPSGHATIAIAFYGFLTYLLLRNTKNKKNQVLIAVISIVVIIIIGLSRLYLGVHYVSDVWAGYLVGLIWLLISISIVEWKLFQENNANLKKECATKIKLIKICLISFGFIFYLVYGLFYHPQLILKLPAISESTTTNITNIFLDYNVPYYTETLTGQTQDYYYS